MFFKHVFVLRFPKQKAITTDALIASLAPHALTSTMSTEMQAIGWVPPRENGPLVESTGKQFLFALGFQKKLLPTSVINQFTKIKSQEIEEAQGFKVGRKQVRDIKEQVTDELLPRAFTIATKTTVWIDELNGWLVINSSAAGKHDDVIKLLLKSLPDLKFESVRVTQSPLSAMTQWLQEDESPLGFTIDSDSELRSSGDGVAKVRYVNQTLEAEDVKRHISSGKQCSSLALTWNDRLSFVLTENLGIKKITPFDILKESESVVLNDDERFDAEFLLMTGELNKLFVDLFEGLGGLVVEESKAA